MPSTIPRDGLGLGVRPPHWEELLSGGHHRLDYVEIISENFLGDAPLPRARLRELARHLPIVLHGVGLNLLGPTPPSKAYLDSIRRLADDVDAHFVTDHLCWTGTEAISHHDLLPVPFTEDLVGFAAERAHAVAQAVGRPFGLENLSSYAAFRDSEMEEADFFNRVVHEANCGILLDVNNIFVSARNLGFDPMLWLERVEWSRILQVHIAGHEHRDDGVLVDTHDHPVRDEVWELYREVWRRGGPFPTLLERDDRIPPFEDLVLELERCREERA